MVLILILAIVEWIAGVVLLVMALKMREGTLRRNQFSGVRTRWTLANDEAWQAAHKSVWPHNMLLAALMIAGGVVVLFWTFDETMLRSWAFWVLIAIYVGLFVLSGVMVRAANAAARPLVETNRDRRA